LTKDEIYRSVGVGWKPLLDELVNKIDPSVITCVKEKFGALRIYTETTYTKTDFGSDSPAGLEMKMLNDLEDRSLTICEYCGKPGTLTGEYWLKTTCAEHAKR
jgi:hypothetical protein